MVTAISATPQRGGAAEAMPRVRAFFDYVIAELDAVRPLLIGDAG